MVSTSGRAPNYSRGFLLVTGLAGGLFGGLVGGGGGTLIVPTLDHYTTLPRAECHGTATVANIFIAVAAVTAYLISGGHIDLITGAGMIVGGVIGAQFGARFAKNCNEAVLRAIFIIVLALSALDFLIHAIDGTGGTGGHAAALLPLFVLTHPMMLFGVAVGFGLIVGAWSSAMGLGGGILAVPILSILFGLELHVAAGTSLLIMVPNTISGGIAHLRQGTAKIRIGMMIGLGALSGSVVGILVAQHLSSHRLSVLFCGFLVVIVARESRIFVRKYLSH